MKPKVYFIGGASGVGKSSVIPYLKNSLAQDLYEIYDLDERGVPENVSEQWRQEETRYWLEFAQDNIKKGISTIVCGYVIPDEVVRENIYGLDAELCLLDIDESLLEERLQGRFNTPEKLEAFRKVVGLTPEGFVKNNIKSARKIREDFSKHGAHLIDTTGDSQKVVASKISTWIKRAEAR